jgi:hypothetical protein
MSEKEDKIDEIIQQMFPTIEKKPCIRAPIRCKLGFHDWYCCIISLHYIPVNRLWVCGRCGRVELETDYGLSGSKHDLVGYVHPDIAKEKVQRKS